MSLTVPATLILRVASFDAAGVDSTQAQDRAELPADCGEKRVTQFLLGRRVARLALRDLGLPPDTKLPRLPTGAVQWPLTIVGSIAHSADRAAVLMGRSDHYRSVGLDLENLAKERDLAIAERICTPHELFLLQQLPENDRKQWMIALFSAKEALFKLLHPLTATFFGFHDVESCVTEVGLNIELCLLRALSPEFQVGWRTTVQLGFFDDFVISGCWIER